jgi:type III pantothenate kinase
VLLVVDIGNSQTSYGIYDCAGEKSQLIHHWRAETKVQRTVDEYAALLLPLFQHAGLSTQGWDGVAICSVVPAAEMALESFSQSFLGCKPVKVNSRSPLGFSLNVDTPSEVGADRIANAAYAVAHLSLPAIVVDLGTATTFDVVSKAPAYEGGIILPGVRIGVEALSSRTAKLPLIDLQLPPSPIGKNTIDCIRSGILYGYCDLIDGLLDRLIREVGGKAEVALTGGLAFLFQSRMKTPARYLPNLTLDGIELIYSRACTASP